MMTAAELAESVTPAVPLFGPRSLSRFTGIEVKALKRWRNRERHGPSFFKVGRLVRYPRAAVVEWLAANATLIEPEPIPEGVGRPKGVLKRKG